MFYARFYRPQQTILRVVGTPEKGIPSFWGAPMHGEHEGTPNMAQLPALALQRSRFLGLWVQGGVQSPLSR